jgi:hypothetical protein
MYDTSVPIYILIQENDDNGYKIGWRTTLQLQLVIKHGFNGQKSHTVLGCEAEG